MLLKRYPLLIKIGSAWIFEQDTSFIRRAIDHGIRAGHYICLMVIVLAIIRKGVSLLLGVDVALLLGPDNLFIRMKS